VKASVGERVLIGITFVVVAVAVIVGIVMIGPPAEERARRLDERRLNQLQGLAGIVDSYRASKGHLPTSLEAIASESGTRIAMSDPVTGVPYGYRVTGEGYELCATFDRASSQRYPGDLWMHGAGFRCFGRKPGSPLL
jgi:type II secretory pathway pseudopilin PulG